MRFSLPDQPVLDTGDLAYRDPLARARPYAYALTTVVAVAMAIAWDSAMWWVGAAMAGLTVVVTWFRRSRRTHAGLVLDALVCGALVATVGLPLTSMAFPWATYIVGGYLLYTRREAKWVVSSVATAMLATVLAGSRLRLVALTDIQLEITVVIAVVIGIGLLMSLVPVIADILEERLSLQDSLVAEGERRVTVQQQFTSMVSHELRSPLTSIKGFSQLLAENADDFPPGDRVEIYRLIDREADNLSMLVDDILMVMRFDAGNLKVAADTVAVRQAADEIMLALGHIAEGHDVVIEVDPKHMAIGDGARIKQVVRNLVTNAIKYGGTDIRISSVLEGECLRLSVEDNGAGVPPEMHAALFAEFSQGANADSSTGFGLGLDISKRLAVLMNGDLEYRDAVPTGACFTLELPAAL